MDDLLSQKLQALKNELTEMGSVAVAFSGGVDSSLLLKVAHDSLGEKVAALTALSCAMPSRERLLAEKLCRSLSVRVYKLETNELELSDYHSNQRDRCYICKREIFGKLKQLAQDQGFACLVEGSNMDDLEKFRPGSRAIKELGIRSPLQEVGLHKSEIRELAQYLDLPTWDKASFSCLATRFPYGEAITREKLAQVEKAEDLLDSLGFKQFRVRVHGGTLARIEVLPEDFDHLMEPSIRNRIVASFKNLGYAYVSLDLQGYRSGSLDEIPPLPQR